jgi:hypothetical protein
MPHAIRYHACAGDVPKGGANDPDEEGLPPIPPGNFMVHGGLMGDDGSSSEGEAEEEARGGYQLLADGFEEEVEEEVSLDVLMAFGNENRYPDSKNLEVPQCNAEAYGVGCPLSKGVEVGRRSITVLAATLGSWNDLEFKSFQGWSPAVCRKVGLGGPLRYIRGNPWPPLAIRP